MAATCIVGGVEAQIGEEVCPIEQRIRRCRQEGQQRQPAAGRQATKRRPEARAPPAHGMGDQEGEQDDSGVILGPGRQAGHHPSTDITAHIPGGCNTPGADQREHHPEAGRNVSGDIVAMLHVEGRQQQDQRGKQPGRRPDHAPAQHIERRDGRRAKERHHRTIPEVEARRGREKIGLQRQVLHRGIQALGDPPPGMEPRRCGQQIEEQRRIEKGVRVRIAAARHANDDLDQCRLVGVLDVGQAPPERPAAREQRSAEERDRHDRIPPAARPSAIDRPLLHQNLPCAKLRSLAFVNGG